MWKTEKTAELSKKIYPHGRIKSSTVFPQAFFEENYPQKSFPHSTTPVENLKTGIDVCGDIQNGILKGVIFSF